MIDKMKSFSLRIPDEEMAYIERKSKEQGMTKSQYIRKLIRNDRRSDGDALIERIDMIESKLRL